MRSIIGKAAWAEIYARRLAWADAGLESFVAALHDSEIQDLYRHRRRGQSIIVTCGPSQVGKTTVLLHMLGIAADTPEASIVESVLRAGRPRGASASATAMRYAIAPDDRWHLSAGGPPFITDREDRAQEFLAKVRAQVSADPNAFEKPVRVDIPVHFAAQAQPCIIIDLPGIGSRDELEQRHVKELLARWLPYASIVLIVLRKDNVSDLERLERSQDLRLRIEPSRYRLVLTYATSAASDRHFLEDRWDGTLAGWQQYVMVDLERTIPGLFEEKKLAIYPFEVGESRRKFTPEFERLVAPLLHSSAEAIRQKLDVTPEGMLVQQAEYHRVVEGHYKEEQARRVAEHQTIEATIEQARDRLKAHRTETDLAKSTRADAAKEVHWWKKLELPFNAFSLPEIPVRRAHNDLTAFTTALDTALCHHLQGAFDAAGLSLPDWLRTARRELIESLQVNLGKYYGGFTGLLTSQNKRRVACEEEALPAVRLLEEKTRRALEVLKEAKLRLATAHYEAAKVRHEGAIENCKREQQLIRVQEHRRRKLIDTHKRKCKDEAAEIAIARQFWAYLDEAWRKQDAQLARELLAARSQPMVQFAISLERGIRALAWRRLQRGAS